MIVRTLVLGFLLLVKYLLILDLQMPISDRAAAALGVSRRGGPGGGEEALQLRDPWPSYLEVP